MNKKIVLVVLGIAVAFPMAPVFAQSDGQNLQMKQQWQQNKGEKIADRQQLQDKNQELKDQKCKNTENRIDTRVKRYENNQSMFQNVFGNMKARLDRLVTRLDSAGADTTKLKADIVTLNGKIDKLNTDYTDFIADLKLTQPLTCGEAQGEFKGKLGEARKLIETVKQDRLDIRKYFQSTIKPDLQAIRKTLADEKKTTETTN